MIRTALLLSLLAAPAKAQVEAQVARLTDAFLDRCALALKDPNAYAATLQIPGPSGERVAANTPDGKVLWVTDFSHGLGEEVYVAVTETEQIRYCQFNHAEFVPGEAADIAAAFEAAIRARPGLSLSGGQITQDVIPGMGHGGHDGRGAGAGIITFDQFYRYMFTGFGDGPGHIGFATIEPASIQLFGFRSISTAAAATETLSDPEPETAEPRPSGAETVLRAAAEACLRNYRTPDQIIPGLKAAGLTITPGMDAGSFEASGPDIWGIVEPGAEQSYCTFQSPTVPLDRTLAIGADIANTLFPGNIQPGHPERGLQTPCDGHSIFAPRRLLWMHFADAGNSGECTGAGGSAIILNM